MRTIEIVINSKGETMVTTKGFSGSACRDASKFIEQALGERTDEQLTAEFHTTESVQQTGRMQA